MEYYYYYYYNGFTVHLPPVLVARAPAGRYENFLRRDVAYRTRVVAVSAARRLAGGAMAS